MLCKVAFDIHKLHTAGRLLVGNFADRLVDATVSAKAKQIQIARCGQIFRSVLLISGSEQAATEQIVQHRTLRILRKGRTNLRDPLFRKRPIATRGNPLNPLRIGLAA